MKKIKTLIDEVFSFIKSFIENMFKSSEELEKELNQLTEMLRAIDKIYNPCDFADELKEN